MWYLYILKCRDGSYYIGRTNTLQQRIERHNKARAAKWTSDKLPVRLVYQEKYEFEHEAIRRERQIKRWSRKKKQALIAGDFKRLKALSKSK